MISQIGKQSDDESWEVFTEEKLPSIKDKYDMYSIQLRKQIIESYHDRLTSILATYFRELRSKVPTGSSEEPANVSAPILKIAQVIYNELLADLGVSFDTKKFG